MEVKWCFVLHIEKRAAVHVADFPMCDSPLAYVSPVPAGHVGLDVVDMLFNANNLVFMAARVPQV